MGTNEDLSTNNTNGTQIGTNEGWERIRDVRERGLFEKMKRLRVKMLLFYNFGWW